MCRSHKKNGFPTHETYLFYHVIWRAENREKVLEAHREDYHRNKKKRLAAKKAWRTKNIEKHREYHRMYMRRYTMRKSI